MPLFSAGVPVALTGVATQLHAAVGPMTAPLTAAHLSLAARRCTSLPGSALLMGSSPHAPAAAGLMLAMGAVLQDTFCTLAGVVLGPVAATAWWKAS
jgi:hypothetical protein